MIVDQGEIYSLTYEGEAIDALELAALRIRRAIVVPSSGAKLPEASSKTPSMMSVLAALEMSSEKDQSPSDQHKIDIGEVFSER